MLTIERILAMAPKMTETEQKALHEWEGVNLGPGGLGTSDWPGWADVSARLQH